MTSIARIACAGVATLVLAGSAEAMPIATATAPTMPVVKTAVIVTKVIRRRPLVRVIRPRPKTVIIKKVIR